MTDRHKFADGIEMGVVRRIEGGRAGWQRVA